MVILASTADKTFMCPALFQPCFKVGKGGPILGISLAVVYNVLVHSYVECTIECLCALDCY